MHNIRRHPWSRSALIGAPRLSALFLAGIIVAGFPALLPADEPEKNSDSVFAAAKAAIKENHVDKTDMHGFTIEKTLFNELPADGAVLIGLDRKSVV